VRARRGDPRGVGVVRRPDDEQTINDVARRLETAFDIELAQPGKTVRPTAVLGPTLVELVRRRRDCWA